MVLVKGEENERQKCEQFAIDNKLIFEDEGHCGFGRECVGFLSKSGNWLNYCPIDNNTYEPIAEYNCSAVEPPDEVNAYHKANCMAVLGRGDGAIAELAMWVDKINAAGNIRIVSYKTGSVGLQAMLTGVTDYTIMAGGN